MDKRPDYLRLNRPVVRIALLAFLVILAILLLASQIGRLGLTKLAPNWSLDYQQYWGAARVLVAGGNPYDAVTLTKMEATTGIWIGLPVRLWNPPYTLMLALPFAALPFDLAALAWLATSALVVMVCGAALWRLFAPHGDRRYWLGMIMAIAYLPTLQTLEMGQISVWLLAGITGFLVALRARRDTLAGAALILLAIKPHVSFLFLLAIAWWIVREHRWRVLLGASATLAVACTLVGLISPAVFGQYLRAAAGLPLYWRTATLGTWLRTIFGFELYWLQLLPSVLGVIILAVWITRHREAWDWPWLLPVLLLGSTIFAAYGWSYDTMILLPVVIILISRLRTLPVREHTIMFSAYIVAQFAMLTLNQLSLEGVTYYWYPLVLAGLYAWQQGITRLTPHQGTDEITQHG